MTRPIRILSVEDDENDDLLTQRELLRAGIVVGEHRRVDTMNGLCDALTEKAWDVCICDYNLVSFDALSALHEIRRRGLDLPTLVVTGSLDEESAATMFHAGARDLIRKGRLGRLGPAVERELHEAASRREAGLAAEQLRASQALLGAFMRHLPVFAFVKDASDRYLFASDAFLRFFGRTTDELVGKTSTEAFGPEIGGRFQTNMDDARAAEKTLETAECLVDSEGRTRDVSMIRFRVGERTGLTAGIGFDVTERKRAEEAIRMNEERFRTVAEAMPDGLLTATKNGEIRYANRAAEHLLGRTRDEMYGTSLTALIAPRERAAYAVQLAELFGGTPASGRTSHERTMLAKDGSRVPVELSLAAWELHGETFMTAIVRDTRARHALEEQVRHAQKMEAVGQLASGVAHDFNNILGVISAYAELVGEVVGEDVRDDVEEIRLAVRRGAALVGQLLMFSRKQVVQPIYLSPDEVVIDMQKMLSRAAGPRIECTFELDTKRRGVIVDRGHLEQVLMNLVVNARDAIAARTDALPGRIAIATRVLPGVAPELGSLVLSVTDNGIGMDEATQARVFEPFFTTKAPGKGTGLGLSTVHGIVEQAGGEIEIRSKLGEGTTVSIIFECSRPGGTPSAGIPRVFGQPKPAIEELGHRAPAQTIVLVEDESGLRAATARTLRREGHNVIELPRAEDALGVARTLGAMVRLVVADLGLPGMSGIELLRALRAEGSTVPVLLMSGTASDTELAEVETLPRIQKPIAGPELIARVREAMALAQGTR